VQGAIEFNLAKLQGSLDDRRATGSQLFEVKLEEFQR
jgi:hypothetical protein